MDKVQPIPPGMHSLTSYLLLIVEPRGQRATRAPEEPRRLYDGMVAFGADLRSRGQLLSSESLLPDEHAVRLRAPPRKWSAVFTCSTWRPATKPSPLPAAARPSSGPELKCANARHAMSIERKHT